MWQTNNNTCPLSTGSAKSFCVCVCVKLLILCTVSVLIKKKNSQSLFKLFQVYKINLNSPLNPLVLASYSNTHSNVFSHTTSTTNNKNTWNILMLAAGILEFKTDFRRWIIRFLLNLFLTLLLLRGGGHSAKGLMENPHLCIQHKTSIKLKIINTFLKI